MSDRLVAAEAALKAGRRDEAIEQLIAAITEDPARAAPVYRALVVQLYHAGRNEEGADWAAKALERFPRDSELWNTRAVLLRRQKRYAEGLAAIDQALKLNPKMDAAHNNRGNLLLDLGQAAKAEPVFAKLVRANPRNGEAQRQLGRALIAQGKTEAGLVRLRQAVSVNSKIIDAWLDIAGHFNEKGRSEEAEANLQKALAANPDEPRLLEARAIIMRRSGQMRQAAAYLESLLPRFETAAWLHYQLAGVIADYDRPRANIHFRRATELDPDNVDYLIAMIESLERTRTGDEGANIEQAYQIARNAPALWQGGLTPSQEKVVYELLVRVCDFDAVDKLGDFQTLGRSWAEGGRHSALLKQLARVRTDADREELLEEHRIWGRQVAAMAAARPITKPPRRPADGKVRVGFMSSDLRNHPVGYFALPLMENIDRERFEVYCYSYYQGQEDRLQAFMTQQVTAYRWWPEISVRDAAQAIAEDQLDILIELGGSTHMNKLEVMAYRPAPLQASWLGYPHSAGLAAIDYLVVDPYVMPERADLILERPLMLPHAWYSLGASAFRAEPAAAAEPPVARNGYVTFGTANNPQKYTRDVFRTWARVMRGCPGSKFLFIRPEGGTPTFRENVRATFALEGVAPDRIEFEAVRGAHLPHYNRVDITLDTFSQTGGTTTCEALWMGALCVTLVGEGVFERLSYSVLMNLGLGDFCARDLDQYVDIAVRLAHDPARIAELRGGMRERMRASPLGQSATWAKDFYAAVAREVVADRQPA